jgi:hypothetical protein
MARHSPLALWHLLSLDAPTVAALWTVFLARNVHLNLPWTAPAAMFLAVWMIYVADRLLDSRSLMSGNWQTGAPATGNATGLEARHRFHHRHRGGFLTGIAAAAVALAVLLHRLDPRALQLYALLASLLAAWMLLIHAIPTSAEAPRLPKELAVGLFFPAAVFIPTVARAPLLRAALLPDAALFAAVCTLNCLFVYAWEHAGARPGAHWTTRWSTRHLPQLAIATCVLATLVASLATKRMLAAPSTPAIACALSAALLLLLHTLRRRLTRIHLRACADLALLTPLLFLKTPSS